MKKNKLSNLLCVVALVAWIILFVVGLSYAGDNQVKYDGNTYTVAEWREKVNLAFDGTAVLLKGLIERVETLETKHSNLFQEHNDLVRLYNDLVIKHNHLQKKYNGLIDVLVEQKLKGQ